MIADVYLRISEDRSGEELGVTRQRKRARELLKARGWTLGTEHTDNDLSAAGGKSRPGFEALLKRVADGEVRAVVAWDMSRLARNRHDQVRLFEAAEEREITIALVDGSDLDLSTTAGQLVADLLAGVARAEIRQKAKRQREASQQAADLGKPPGGTVPFGFEPDRINHHPEQAAAIAAAYSEMLAGGTLAGIARAWNDAGLLSGKPRLVATKDHRKGEPSLWRPESVRLLLQNPRNAGLRAHRGKLVGAAVWDAIVPEEMWRATVGLLADPRRRQAAPTPQHLLSGLALCDTCGTPVVSAPSYLERRGSGGKRIRNTAGQRYRCSRVGSGDGSNHVARQGAAVDEWIGALVIERLSRPDAVDLIKPPRGKSPVAALRREQTTIGKRLVQVAADEARDVITRAQFLEQTATHRARLAAIDAELAEAGRVNALSALVGADDVTAVWDALSVPRQRVVVAALMTVRLRPAGRGVRTFDPTSVIAIAKK
jgi:DNA invertase Pin-like site-specific DNA recombinase